MTRFHRQWFRFNNRRYAFSNKYVPRPIHCGQVRAAMRLDAKLTPLRVFISSVQTEFAEERQALRTFLHGDP